MNYSYLPKASTRASKWSSMGAVRRTHIDRDSQIKTASQNLWDTVLSPQLNKRLAAQTGS